MPRIPQTILIRFGAGDVVFVDQADGKLKHSYYNPPSAPVVTDVNAGVGVSVVQRSVTAPYPVLADDSVLDVTGTGDVTLPAPTSGRSLRIQRALSAGVITLVPSSGLIEGAATLQLLVAGESVDIVGDGTNWSIYA